MVARKVETPQQPGFHNHGHTAPVHHAKPTVSKKPSTDDMLAASLQKLPKAGVHPRNPHPKKGAQSAGTMAH
jgi:hypothetical protein